MIERIALQRREAPLQLAQRKLGRRLRRRTVPAPVRPDLIAHLAAQQLIDRHAQRLALDVVQRHLDPGLGAVLDRSAAREVAVMDRLPQLLDPERILARNHAPVFLDQRGHRRWPAGRVAPADNAFVGLDLDEHIVPGREVEHRVRRRSRRSRNRADLRDFHGVLSSQSMIPSRLAPVRHRPRYRSAPATANRSISPSPYPSHSLSTSYVSSPSNRARCNSHGASDSRNDACGARYVPITGWSSRW